MRLPNRHIAVEKITTRPVSIGFIGAGNVLWAYLQALDRLIPRGHAVLGGICARNRRRWPEILARRPGAVLFERTQDLLAADIDVAVVITSPESHAEIARAALSEDKHVLVEKPLAESPGQARRLIDIARRHRRWLVAAPFVHLSPTFAFLRQELQGGAIGQIHTARGLYGNQGSDWANWYHTSGVSPLAEIGIYNLKSLTAILGPVRSIFHREARSALKRYVAGRRLRRADPDVAHTLLTHASGAISSVVSSHAIAQYDRPALEFYGSRGTANLRGDDWDPRGIDLWRDGRNCWETYPAIEPTWLWTDGLTDLVQALRCGRAPVADLGHDLHLIEVLTAAAKSHYTGQAVKIRSPWAAPPAGRRTAHLRRNSTRHLHDHTRPADLQ